MRCLRHKIHLGLFTAFGLSALNWILTLSWNDLVFQSSAEPLWCSTFTLTYFFHLTSFYWSFLEGFYLFLQVQYPLSLASIKFKHFLQFGVGGPIVNTLLWLLLRLYEHNYDQCDQKKCMFMDETPIDLWLMQVPMLVILFWNTFFLIWIMSIVILKLRQNTAMDHDRRHWKAAKALLVMIQPLGLFYILTLVVKPTVTSLENQIAEEVYQAVEACITSTQGFVISLPYCFLNGEVRSVVRNRWRRWRMVRSVGRESATGTITSSTLVINQKGSLQAAAV